MFKILAKTLAVVLAGLCIWVVFALWTGLYSIYSIAPSKEYPDGVTLLVSREAGEPLFNSPDRKVPVKKPESRKGGGIGFTDMSKAKRPLADRTILELPYIAWAYEKSLEPAAAE